MATLAEINQQLSQQKDIEEKQTEVLNDIKDISNKTLAQLGFFQKLSKRRELEAEEAEFEAGKDRGKTSTTTTSPSASSSGKGLFSGLGDMIPSGGLFGLGAALASKLPGYLLGRALPAVLAQIFADEIADYVESATGSQEIGDAVFRGLKLGSLAALISKRLIIPAALLGAVLNEENREKLGDVGDKFGEFGEQLKKFFPQLPTFEGLVKSVTDTVGDALDFLISGINILTLTMKDSKTAEEAEQLEKDAKVLSENFGEFAAALAGLGLIFKRTRRIMFGMLASLASVKLSAEKIPDTMPKAKTGKELLKEAEKFTDKELKSRGIERYTTKAGATAYKVAGSGRGGSLPTPVKGLEETFQKMSNERAAKRFAPKLFSAFKKVPLFAQAFAAYDLYSILSSSDSPEAKASALAGILGGVAGAMGGAKLGALLGAPLGPIGSGLLGLGGGIGGYFFGDKAASGLARYFLDNTPDLFAKDGQPQRSEEEIRASRAQAGTLDIAGMSASAGRDLSNRSGAVGMPSTSAISLQSATVAPTQPSSGGVSIFSPSYVDESIQQFSGTAISAPLNPAGIPDGWRFFETR